MNLQKNISDVFKWDVYTKNELIHFLIMHENMKGKKELFEANFSVELCFSNNLHVLTHLKLRTDSQ